MSRLPQLEAQLVAAAAARPRPREVWRPRVAVALLATACAAAAFLAAAPRHDAAAPPAGEGVPPVPARTLALSRALTEAPAPVVDLHAPIAQAQLPTVAAELVAQTPYPPGLRDDLDWAGKPAAVVHFAPEVQALVEYRAYCLWLRYWLSAQGSPGPLEGAGAVLADIPRWPTQRQTDPYERRVQARISAAVRDGDTATVGHEVELNCRGAG